jgi:hypothetical protein
LAPAEIGVDVVVVVVVEVGSLVVVVEVGFSAGALVEVVVGDAVGWDGATNSCDVSLDVGEVTAVLRGVALVGAFAAVVDVVEVDKDPPVSVAPFVLEAMVDVFW